ncbi:PREDICTED: myb-like protein X [Lupinus angustifolius]|uniref:myb-like protein X n=1 Tax=Lupinus angustifolius TaxID=3871 RepID=UPI00092FA5F9|nr:PREDICTED: myb-like protein X [Lupinus angustifolius]
MSRCFPFPPPGYEKKARTDEVDLLKKEKHREKTHKKEKKDKEKKEKKEKEGRDGKDKEKKDKKEKRRDKKKEKDKHKDKGRDGDKSKIGTSDDNGFPGKAVDSNAGEPHQNEINQSDKKGIFFVEKLTKQHTSHNGEKARENNHLADNKDSKFLFEFDRRIKDNNGGAGNQLVQKFSNTNNHRNDDGTVKLVAKGSDAWPGSKEKLKDMDLDAKKIDGKGIRAEVRPIGNATFQNHAGNFHPRVDGMPGLLEKNFDRTMEAAVEGKGMVKGKKDDERKEEKVKEKKDEGKDRVKEKKDDKRRDRKKDKEKKEKKGHGKDKDRDKEKKKEEKAKEHTELKNTDQNNLKESNKVAPTGLNSFTQVSKNSHENAVSAENIRKRKEIESNGVPRANGNWPNKMPKPSPSHPFTENGKILEPCQVSVPNASCRPGVTTSVKLDNKECKINGFVKAPPPIAASSNKAQIATGPTVPLTEAPAKPPDPDVKFLSQVTKASAKPPHPDTKYISQVYSVPKMEAWSDFDDQEWLFGSSSSQERKPVVKSSDVGDMRQVWAEALHIETADVYALPYVVPY